MNPKLFVIAGPNGAGKSTGAARILPKRFPTERFLNADNIAKALATDSAVEAGRTMLRRIHELCDKKVTFAFETTLAARSYVNLLRDAQRAGYRVHLAYVWLANVDLAKKRVAVRVRRGGHDIPSADIERRYWRGLKNFWDLNRPLVDRWLLCDNSTREIVVVARGRMGKDPIIYEEELYVRFQKAAHRQ